MSKPPDPPNEPPSDPSPATLARLEAILHQHQVPDARLVRSVERRALAYRRRLLRQRLAEMEAEGNGQEPHAEEPE